jgi:hypothetical protein
VRSITIASALVLAGMLLPAHAATKNFIAVINGGQEVPPTASNSFGVAFFTFDTVTKMLCYSLNFTAADLLGAESDCHIHGPASPGVDGVVLFPIATPLGPSPAGSPKTGCVGPWSGPQIRYLNQGRTYINIHTVPNPGGEIRGQIIPVKGR